MNREEQAALQACQAGDLEAFTIFYDAYFQKIYSFLYYKTLHRETAEDLSSQTFLQALRAIADYQPTKSSFSSWLYTIANNLLIDYFRKRRVEVELDENLASFIPDPAQTFDTQERLRKVQEYLQQLPDEQRDIIMMRIWDELSYQEIAEITGKSVASLKMLFSRSIKKLRTDLILLMLASLIT